MTHIFSLVRVAIAISLTSFAGAQTSVTNGPLGAPEWIPTFGQAPGIAAALQAPVPELDGGVRCSVEFDDGTGPALYVGGALAYAGGTPVNGVAKWDGQLWSAVGANLRGLGGAEPEVFALAVFDDGTGPALFAGGSFTTAQGGGRHFARWDGSDWIIAGDGTADLVQALLAFDAGQGTQLYVGGHFQTVGAGVNAPGVAAWDGSGWSPLGMGLGGFVRTLTAHEDGTGERLYAGGAFAHRRGVMRWNGSAWSGIGPASSGVPWDVRCLQSFETAAGTVLVAGGRIFSFPGSAGLFGIAQWSGTAWGGVASGLLPAFGMNSPEVRTLAVHDDGSGPALFVGGDFSGGRGAGVPVGSLLKWRGGLWLSPSLTMTDASDRVRTLAAFDEGRGTGRALFVGGRFVRLRSQDGSETVPARNIARLEDPTWSAVGGGSGDPIIGMAEFDDGSGFGPALYAIDGGGQVKRWSGAEWTLIFGTPSCSAIFRDIAAFDDGTGPSLYVTGFFQSVEGVPANGIARWDGSSLSALGSGLQSVFSQGTLADEGDSLVVWDDGTGPALYVGGSFELAGGLPAAAVAKWDGAAWSALGDGQFPFGADSQATALAVFDDGTGPALFAGGRSLFYSGAVPPSAVAKWDGTVWSNVGGGALGAIEDMIAVDTGNGEELYITGRITSAGPATGEGIARWNGSVWASLAGGLDGDGKGLGVFDDGQGPALFVGGNFTAAGGVPSTALARWDGASWSPLGTGLAPDGYPSAFLGFDDRSGTGPALFVGGTFVQALDSGDSYAAKRGFPSQGARTAYFCQRPNIHSGGRATQLTAQLNSGVGSGLHLEASDGPPNQFGFIVAGTAITNLALPVGDGRLCLDPGAGALGRYSGSGPLNSVGQFDGVGTFQNLSGTSAVGSGFDVPTALPFAGGVVMAGSTYHFQLWHRDLGSSNLSNGASVTF